jgi:two-component system chemotaxis response regulator CheB
LIAVIFNLRPSEEAMRKRRCHPTFADYSNRRMVAGEEEQRKHAMTLFFCPELPDVSVVAMAASQGGLTAVSTILAALSSDFPAAIVIAIHRTPHPHLPSRLASIFQAVTDLTVKEAQAGDYFAPGKVFIAPPDQHVLVCEGGTLALSDGPLVHFTRPAADPLFISVAASCGKNAIGVVLTGGDGDGSDGICAIKEAGGKTVAQSEATCEQFSMPRSAIKTGQIDFVVALDDIAPLLVHLVQTLQWDYRQDKNLFPFPLGPAL